MHGGAKPVGRALSLWREAGVQDVGVKTTSLRRGHCVPAAIICQAVCWYYGFQLSLHDMPRARS